MGWRWLVLWACGFSTMPDSEVRPSEAEVGALVGLDALLEDADPVVAEKVLAAAASWSAVTDLDSFAAAWAAHEDLRVHVGLTRTEPGWSSALQGLEWSRGTHIPSLAAWRTLSATTTVGLDDGFVALLGTSGHPRPRWHGLTSTGAHCLAVGAGALRGTYAAARPLKDRSAELPQSLATTVGALEQQADDALTGAWPVCDATKAVARRELIQLLAEARLEGQVLQRTQERLAALDDAQQ